MSHNHTGENGSVLRKARERLRPLVESGSAVCWRCGRPILVRPDGKPDPWDAGHTVDLAAGGGGSIQPEHRHRTPWCAGNRSSGGKLGARMTNQTKRQERRMPSW